MQLRHLLNLMGDRLHTLPVMVVMLTDGCNSRCATCDIWRNPRRNMPMRLAQALAESARELGTRWVLLSGGEALQHPQWQQIAALFRAQGIRVMMLTNGLLMKRQAQAIAEHIDDLIVSLDGGTPQTYADIRGVDAFNLLLEGITTVATFGGSVSTRTTVQRRNFREIPLIADVALNAGAGVVSYLAVDVSNPIAFGVREASDSDALSNDDNLVLDAVLEQFFVSHAAQFAAGQIAESPAKLRRTLSAYFRGLQGDGASVAPRCNAPRISTVIEVDGTVRPCYFLPDYGKWRPGERLTDVLNTPAALALRQQVRRGERSECQGCVCPLYKGARELVTLS